MGILDLIIAIIIIFGLWRGFNNGFIRTAVSLVGWFIALVAATRWASSVAPHLANYVDSAVLQLGLGFLVVVLITLLVVQIFASIAKSLVDRLKISFIDQLAGAILGATKNLLIVLVLLSVMAPVLIRLPFWQSATLAPALMQYAPFAKTFVTEVLGDAWKQIDAPDTDDAT